MKVFRFMSREELIHLMRGDTIENHTKHFERSRTNSVGCCFLDADEYEPEMAYHFLNGLVSMEVCVMFETDEKNLNKSWGDYSANALDEQKQKKYKEEGVDIEDWLELFEDIFVPSKRKYKRVNEYCTESYSLENFKIIGIATPQFMEDCWNWE